MNKIKEETIKMLEEDLTKLTEKLIQERKLQNEKSYILDEPIEQPNFINYINLIQVLLDLYNTYRRQIQINKINDVNNLILLSQFIYSEIENVHSIIDKCIKFDLIPQYKTLNKAYTILINLSDRLPKVKYGDNVFINEKIKLDDNKVGFVKNTPIKDNIFATIGWVKRINKSNDYIKVDFYDKLFVVHEAEPNEEIEIRYYYYDKDVESITINADGII